MDNKPFTPPAAKFNEKIFNKDIEFYEKKIKMLTDQIRYCEKHGGDYHMSIAKQAKKEVYSHSRILTYLKSLKKHQDAITEIEYVLNALNHDAISKKEAIESIWDIIDRLEG